MASVTVPCPHCGNVGTHDTRNTQNAAIVVNCRDCHKNFYIQIRGGEVQGVRK
jgi:uncharacterized Zn finger protein